MCTATRHTTAPSNRNGSIFRCLLAKRLNASIHRNWMCSVYQAAVYALSQHQQHAGSGCDIISFTKVLSRVKFRFTEKLLRGEVIMRRIFSSTLFRLPHPCVYTLHHPLFAFRWQRRLHANERESWANKTCNAILKNETLKIQLRSTKMIFYYLLPRIWRCKSNCCMQRAHVSTEVAWHDA